MRVAWTIHAASERVGFFLHSQSFGQCFLGAPAAIAIAIALPWLLARGEAGRKRGREEERKSERRRPSSETIGIRQLMAHCVTIPSEGESKR